MDHRWVIEQIVPAPMVKDVAGNTLNGAAYKVTLTNQQQACTITLVITRWAESEAEQRQPGITLAALARSYVLEELSRGWEPESYPWLTLDSESITDLLQKVSPVEAELASSI
jgi:hypothetical protein